jgi:hypothetical protein
MIIRFPNVYSHVIYNIIINNITSCFLRFSIRPFPFQFHHNYLLALDPWGLCLILGMGKIRDIAILRTRVTHIWGWSIHASPLRGSRLTPTGLTQTLGLFGLGMRGILANIAKLRIRVTHIWGWSMLASPFGARTTFGVIYARLTPSELGPLRNFMHPSHPHLGWWGDVW